MQDQTIYKTLIKFLIGVGIILTIIWLRFLKHRTVVTLEDFISTNNIFLISLYLVFFFYFLFLFYINLKKIFNITKDHMILLNITNKTLFLKIKKILIEYVISTPEFVYNKTTERYSIKNWIELPASYFTAYFNYPKIVVWVLLFIPRLLVAFVFMFELIIFHKLEFFILIINLLIPFIIAKVLFFIFLQYSQRTLNYLELFLNVSKDEEYDLIYHLKAPEDIPKNIDIPFSRIIQQYDTMCNLYTIYSQIRDYMLEIKTIESSFNSFITLITSICYLSVWSYILIQILQ